MLLCGVRNNLFKNDKTKKVILSEIMLSILILKGTWECKDGATEVDFRNWGDGEPIGDDCGLLRISGWGAVPCSWLYQAVCKQPEA